jgi:hypothetical protein
MEMETVTASFPCSRNRHVKSFLSNQLMKSARKLTIELFSDPFVPSDRRLKLVKKSKIF